jgi:hypothetical protein
MSAGMWVVMGAMMVVMMGGMAYAGARSLWRRMRGRHRDPGHDG